MDESRRKPAFFVWQGCLFRSGISGITQEAHSGPQAEMAINARPNHPNAAAGLCRDRGACFLRPVGQIGTIGNAGGRERR